MLAYETSQDQVANDFFSVGPGRLTEDGLVVFDISEPVPPSDAPTAPDPSYVYDGGTAHRPRALLQWRIVGRQLQLQQDLHRVASQPGRDRGGAH